MTAVLLIAAPGPQCYEALAGGPVLGRVGAVPEGGLPLGGTGATLPPSAAGDSGLQLPEAGLTPGALPAALPSIAPDRAPELPSAQGASLVPSVLNALTPAVPESAAAQPFAPLSSIRSAPGTDPLSGRLPAEAASTIFPSGEAAREGDARSPILASVQHMGNMGAAGGARFDGAAAGALKAADDALPADAAGAADTPQASGLAPAQAPAALQRYTGGPAGPTQPYTLGKIGTVRHAIAQWLLKKLDLYEGLYNFPAWFGNWSKWIAIWPLYSQVLHMRLHNMFTTRHLTNETPPPAWTNTYDQHPAPDGAWTDLKDGNIGRQGIAMSHNMPLEMIKPKDIGAPLLKVAEELMPRRKFTPVPLVNSHFAAEIQFQIEGWFGSLFDRLHQMKIEVPKGFAWAKPVMEVAHTQQAPNKKPGVAMPVYNNVEASAWNLNQVYGSTPERMRQLRTEGGKGAKLLIAEDGLLPLDPAYPSESGGGVDLTGQARNIWALRSVWHLDWAKEHNDIVDEQIAYLKNGPAKDDGWLALLDRGNRRRLWEKERAQFDAMTEDERQEWLYWRARTIAMGENAGMHTHDWTEELLPGAVTKLGMEIDYYGILGRTFKKWWYPKMWMHKWFGWLLKRDLLSGLPGSKVQRWSAPYDLGQTFLKVYRMRELMRDVYRIFSLKSGEKRSDVRLRDMQGVNTRRALTQHAVDDWAYSGGLNFPGDIVLNNVTPELRPFLNLATGELRHFETMDGREVDMALMDILRDDERGFPRYNDYRRALHLPAPRSMLELTGGNWELAQRMDRVYRRYLKEMYVLKHRDHFTARFSALQGRTPEIDELLAFASEAPEPTDLEVVESVHAHVGLRASPRMPGMVLSVDAYIIFTLNAPDRFAANRLLSEQFNFDTYGEVGIRRVMNFNFKNFLLRHHPSLDLALDGKASGFNPMNRLHPQLDPRVDAEEKAMGIVTHSLDSIGSMGPRALDALYANSEAGTIPDGVSSGRAIILQGTWLGGLLSKLANAVWAGKIFDAAAGRLKNRILGMKIVSAEVAQGESWSDSKPSIIIDYLRTSWLAFFIRDEIRQVGPTTYLGKAYIRFFGLKLFGLHFALDFAPAAAKPAPGYQELSDEVERSGLRLIKTGFLLSAAAAGVTLATGAFSLAPLLLLGAAFGLHVAALLSHNKGRGRWKDTLAATGMGELGALQGLRFLNNEAARPDRRGGLLSLAAVLIAAAALHAVMAPLGFGLALASLGLAAAYLMTALAQRMKLGRDLENLRISLYSVLKKGRPVRDSAALPGDSHLEKHVRFFSIGNPIMGFWTTLSQIKKLGIPGLMTALSSHLLFSPKTMGGWLGALSSFFSIDTRRIVNAEHPAHTGVYGPDGNIVDPEFERIFAEFGAVDAEGEQVLTAAGIARMRAANRLRARARGVSWLASWFSYFASKRQFDQLLMVAPDRLAWENGKWVPAVSRGQLHYWYEGGLRYDIAQEHESPRP